MIKKFLFAFILSLFSIGFIKASAEQQILKLNDRNVNYWNWFLNDNAFTNTTNFNYNGYTFCKPCIVRIQNSNNAHYYIIANTSSNRYNNVSGNYTSWANYNAPYDMSTNNYTYELYSCPMFSDWQNASLYSRGLEFDASSLLGGYNPPFEYDDSVKYSIDVSGFDSQLKISNGSRFGPVVGFYFEWTENPTIPDDCDRIFNIDFSYMNKSTLETLYYTYGTDGISWQTLCAVFNTIFNSGVSGNIDYSDSMLTTKFVMDFDKTIIDSTYDTWLDYSTEEQSNNILKHQLNWKEMIPTGAYTSDINPNGIIGFLINYYGDLKKALFSLSYVSFNFIDSYVIKYTQTSKKVYDWYNTYYIDLKKSDGTVYQHRSFRTQNSINNNDIDQTPPENIIGDDNTPIPSVDLPTEERQSSYNQSIQDSYNNVVNNYYYNNNYNNSILDYYNSFSDGGTDEDINGALGYVKSTLGSLTHVPILLGMCFTGFLPNEVILLFNALLIIFVVFLIVRIIKHLFTH